jgi:hypothetical protein
LVPAQIRVEIAALFELIELGAADEKPPRQQSVFLRAVDAHAVAMIEYRWEQSLSPGNEQSFYWGSAAADQQGSRNYMGVKSPAVDTMIAALLRARERPDFVAAVRALDPADFRLLCRAPVLFARAMGGAPRPHPPSGADLAVRLSLR